MSDDAASPKPRGHWTAGKPRHPRRGVAPALHRLAKLLRSRPSPGRVSLRAAAAAIGVDPRTLRRQLSGEDTPHPDRLAALTAWLDRIESARS